MSMNPDHRVSVANAVSRLEFQRGYLLTEGDVVIMGLNDRNMAGPMCTLVAADVRPGETMIDGVDEALPMFPPEYRNLMIIGKDVPDTFHDEVSDRLIGNDEGFAVLKRYTLAGNDVWESGTGGTEPDQQLGQPFDYEGPVPDVSAEMVAQGSVVPAATRDEYLERFDPAEEPGFEELSPEQARRWEGKISPGERVEKARRLLHESTREPRGAAGQAGRHQLIAGLVTADPLVRDSVAIEASSSDELTERLVRIYREAPESQRPAVAAAAATAHTLKGGSIRGAQHILEHTTSDPEQARVGRLAIAAVTSGRVAVPQVRESLAESVHDAVAIADQRWRAEQVTSRGAREIEYQPPVNPMPDAGPEVS